MISLNDYFNLSLSRVDECGNEETRCYSLPVDLKFEEHYVCFLLKLIEDKVFLQNEHLEDIASRYASAVAEKMQSLAPLTPKT
jgi:hypothetical protein